MAVESSVLRYMKDRRLYGFGRQSRLERMVMLASDSCSLIFSDERRWMTLAGIAVAIGAIGVVSRLRKGGTRECPIR